MNYEKIFSRLESKKVIVLGDVMLDYYIVGSVERISPEAPVPVVQVQHTEYRFGGAANVAKNLQTLGLQPILASVIGDDSYSDIYLSMLKSNNLAGDLCVQELGRKTSVKSRVLAANQQMLRFDYEQHDEILPNTRNELLHRIKNYIQQHSVAAIVFQDYDKGVLSSQLIAEVTQLAQHNSIPTFVDPKKRNFSNYTSVTLFKPNYKEFTEGIAQHCDKSNIEQLYALAKKFMLKQNIGMLMLTLSERGILLALPDSYIHLPTQVRSVADVSGAGDTVISTAVACYIATCSPNDIVRIANIAAGLVCEKPGVVTVSLNELLQHI